MTQPNKGSIRQLVRLRPPGREDEHPVYPVLTSLSQGCTSDDGSVPSSHLALATISVEPLIATPDTFDAAMERRLMAQLREQLVNQGLYCGIDASLIPQWRCSQFDLCGADISHHVERIQAMLTMTGGQKWFVLRHGTMGDTSRLADMTVHHHPEVPATEVWIIEDQVTRLGHSEEDPCMAILLTSPMFSAIVHNVGDAQ